MGNWVAWGQHGVPVDGAGGGVVGALLELVGVAGHHHLEVFFAVDCRGALVLGFEVFPAVPDGGGGG